MNFLMDAAFGRVFPSPPGNESISFSCTCKVLFTLNGSSQYLFACITGMVVHGVPLAPGYARVQVETYNPAFENCPLPKVQEGGHLQTVSDAVNSFVQWPKKDIVLTSAPSGMDFLLIPYLKRYLTYTC